jgi:hypothetical protein
VRNIQALNLPKIEYSGEDVYLSFGIRASLAKDTKYVDVSIALAGAIEDTIRRAYQNRTLESMLEYEEKFESSRK